jgi:PAS domain S-box-containing protein
VHLPIFPLLRQTIRLSAVLLFAITCLFPKAIGAHEDIHKHVLVLHSYHPDLPWTKSIMEGIQEVFAEAPEVQFYIEYLDTQRYPDPEYFSEVLTILFHHKLEQKQFDLVVLSDNDALNFVLQHSDDLFARTPVVFCGINNFTPAMLAGHSGFTGIAERPSYRETIDAALSLHPATTEIIVIGGVANATSAENRQMLANLLTEQDYRVTFTFWDDVPVEDLTERLANLSTDTLVLVNGSVAARSGETLSHIDGMHLIRNNCARPIYSLWDFFLGEGIVGGKLVSGREQGSLAAKLGLRVLAGEDADAMPVTQGANRFMFDFNELKRFGLSLRRLPENSTVINEPPPFYALSRRDLLIGLTIMTGLVAILIVNLFRRIRAESALREQKERVDLLLNSTAEAIYGIDPQGICTFCNPAALRLLGYRHPDELLGKNIHELIHHTHANGQPHGPEECRLMLVSQRAEGVHLDCELLWRADGTSFPAEVWSHPIRRAAAIIGAVVTFLDISERKEAEARSEEAYRELNAFVYTVSHDLRTPLTAIIGYSEFLQDHYADRGDENVRGALMEIQSQGERMTAMMEDLLDLAKVGRIELPEEPVDTDGIVNAVLRDMAEQVAGIEVSLQKKSLPTARIPETLLTQIFANLIGNAVRYAGKEGGPIEIGGMRKDRKIRYFVRDHGPGVLESERERIFDVFQRGSVGKKSSGTGIGLATVGKIARNHGGQAWVEETPGGGATFWVEMVDERRQTDTAAPLEEQRRPADR